MTLLAAVLIVIGLVGIVVPLLPGLLLVLAGVAVWAISTGTPAAWACLGVCVALVVVGSIVKYLVPGRRLREQGVPWYTLLVGALLGVIGFFVVPVLGLVLGFVFGVYLAELIRLHDTSAAWPSTRRALAAVGWSIMIELATGLLATVVWLGTLLLT